MRNTDRKAEPDLQVGPGKASIGTSETVSEILAAAPQNASASIAKPVKQIRPGESTSKSSSGRQKKSTRREISKKEGTNKDLSGNATRQRRNASHDQNASKPGGSVQASTRTSKVNKRKSAKADKQTSNRSKVLARSSIAAQDTKATRNLSGKTASVDKAASFEDEIFFSLQHQRNKWAATAIASMGLSVLCLASVMLLLPLKETRPYVVMVDKTTGEAEKIVEVRPTSLAEEEVVLQAELVSYISDRETYDVMDNATRIPEVLARSSGEAAHQLRSQWSGEHANYPPDLYGESSRILVKIKSITKLDDDLARVRFTKLREDRNGESLSRDFVATVQFEFLPEARRTLQTVWKNPLGFFVVNYRIDPETR